ncbi:hypothetical protein [Falsiroseomonas bella]|nr:hypothetical protein [Falsiroseomonas bella]
MQRRALLGLAFAGLPMAALAQPRMTEAQRRQFHDEVLARDFSALPPGAQQRVTEAFRAGTPDLPEADVQARWNAMTAQQRGEVLTMHERRRGRGPGMGPGGGRGPGPGPGPNRPPG